MNVHTRLFFTFLFPGSSFLLFKIQHKLKNNNNKTLCKFTIITVNESTSCDSLDNSCSRSVFSPNRLCVVQPFVVHRFSIVVLVLTEIIAVIKSVNLSNTDRRISVFLPN